MEIRAVIHSQLITFENHFLAPLIGEITNACGQVISLR